MEYKECTCCGILKPVTEFYFRPDRNGYISKCKPCTSSSYVARYLNDPTILEVKRKYAREYYSKNASKMQAQKKERRETDLTSKIKFIYRNSKQRANKLSLAFNLSIEYLLALYTAQKGTCALSGEVLEIQGDRYLSNMLSLDRINSSRGYTEDNVQWVCVKYNMMKAHATQEDFLEMCKQVVGKLTCPV